MDIVVSCPNFLRPIYHTLSAGQTPKRGLAPRKRPMPATALVFMFDCYRPAFTCHGTDLLSGRFTISGSCWPFADAVRSGLHHLRVSVPEPCPVSDASHQPLDRVLACCYLYIFVSYAAIGACEAAGCLISFNSFCGS